MSKSKEIIGTIHESVHVHAITDPNYHIDTDVVGYLTFPNGIRASFDSSFNLAMRNEYRVFGTKGSIVVPRAYRPDNNGGDGLIIVETNGVTRTETLNADQYRNELNYHHLAKA